jgi:hypothetical protein
MLEASCHCGAVRLSVPAAPGTVTDCNCSICRKLGVLWAYYDPRDVEVAADPGMIARYARQNVPGNPDGEPMLAFLRCATCGCTTHWRGFDESHPKMGINARLMEPAVLAAARVRHLDGAVTWRYLDEDAAVAGC